MAHGAAPTEVGSDITEPGWVPPRWTSPAALVLALIGLGVSTYLTIAHYGSSVALAFADGL